MSLARLESAFDKAVSSVDTSKANEYCTKSRATTATMKNDKDVLFNRIECCSKNKRFLNVDLIFLRLNVISSS